VPFGAVTNYGWLPGPTLEFFGLGGYGSRTSIGNLVGGIGGIGFGGWTGLGPYQGNFPGDTAPETKNILASILDALGRGGYEQGVFDRAVPSVPVVLHPEILSRTPTIPSTLPEFIPQESIDPKNPEAEVAIDWGGIITGLGTQYIQAQYAPPVQQFFPGGPIAQPMPEATVNMGGPTGITLDSGGSGNVAVNGNALCPPAGSCGGPRYLTYDCKTGQMSLRRRRRRRRLLTDGDKQDLGVIVAMFGKGAAAQIALAAAVKR